MTLTDFIRARAQETYPEPPSPGHEQITAQMVAEVAQQIRASIPDNVAVAPRVLDVGCGQGVAIEKFQKLGCRVTGITLCHADFAILKAKELAPTFMDMHEMPEEWTGRYNLVWARHVLEHSVAPYFVLSEFARVLKPGGLLYVEVPGPDTDCVHESNKNHYAVMGAQMWEHLILRAGFDFSERREMKLQTAAGPDVYFGWVCRKVQSSEKSV